MSDESRTGDLAKWLGMTTNGVRYLERQGVIDSSRSPNGYRSYDNESFVKAVEYRRYRDLGMTERDAVDALRESPDELTARLNRLDETLRKEYERRKASLDLARERLSDLRRGYGPASFAMRVPAHGYVPLTGPTQCDAQQEWLHDAMEWGRHVPFVQMGMIATKSPEGAWRLVRIHTAALEDVTSLGLPQRHMTVVDEGLFVCLSMTLYEGKAEDFDPTEALEEMRLAGFKTRPGMVEVRVKHVNKEENGLVSHVLLMVPLAE